MGAQRLPNHEARCPRNPEMFARLRQFMHDYAEHGVGLPATLYSDLIIGEYLPSVSQLNRVFGTWGDFVRACGLEHRPYHGNDGPKPELMPGSVMADDFEWHDPSVLRCYERTRQRLQWDLRTRSYQPAGYETVMAVR